MHVHIFVHETAGIAKHGLPHCHYVSSLVHIIKSLMSDVLTGRRRPQATPSTNVRSLAKSQKANMQIIITLPCWISPLQITQHNESTHRGRPRHSPQPLQSQHGITRSKPTYMTGAMQATQLAHRWGHPSWLGVLPYSF
jgi:hypothetical protein